MCLSFMWRKGARRREEVDTDAEGDGQKRSAQERDIVSERERNFAGVAERRRLWDCDRERDTKGQRE